MAATTSETELPAWLARFFWDTDPAGLRLPEHEHYCIERLLEFGDDAAIGWLQRTFRTERIAAVVRQSRAISRRTANLWGLVLGIPRSEMRCFSTPSLLQHGSFSDESP